MKNKDTEKKTSSRKFKGGTYSIIICIIAVVIVFAVNLVVGQLPSSVTKIDTTQTGVFTLSDQTKEVMSKLDQKVTAYLICQSGSENNTVTTVLNRYKDLNNKFEVVKVDPNVNPSFTQQYTKDTVNDNSIIVVSEKRNMVVAYSDMFTTDYNTYTTSFSGENALTGAIDYVTSETLPKVYMLTGHDEQTLSTSLKSQINTENLETADLNLVTSDIPKDAACIMVYAPQSDISSDEEAKLQTYLEGGGKMLLISDYSTDGTPNLDSLMSNFGAKRSKGVVFEGDSNKYLSSQSSGALPFVIVPTIASHKITDPIISASLNVIFPYAEGLVETTDHRKTITVTPLLTTSDSSYSKVISKDTQLTNFDKAAGDAAGPFNLALAIDEQYNDAETKIVWFGSSYFLQDTFSQYSSGANTDLLINSLGWMCNKESSISIRAVDVSAGYLMVSDTFALVSKLVMFVVLPIGSIAAGIVIYIRRRKRA